MTALHLAGPTDADRLLPMITAFHDETGISQKPEARSEALMPLLEGSPYGAAYLVGPARAPIGYVVICFGWSLEMGGMEGYLDEIYIRPGVRGRGIGSEVLQNLPKALAGAGLRALHLEARRDDPRIDGFYRRNKFEARPDALLMTRRL